MHNDSRMGTILFVMACAVISWAGCASSRASPNSKRLAPSEIFASLKQSYPGGVAPAVAQKRMEENGFACTRIRNGTFAHRRYNDDGSVENRTLTDIDFIRCKRETRQGVWVTTYDDVALVIENGVVVDALPNWSAVGP